MSIAAQWWGHSKEHGWVVLDRELACNNPGERSELLFFRCRDSKVYFVRRELWRLPSYQFAPNFVLAHNGPAADEARAQLAELMDRWPEFSTEIRRQQREIEDRRAEAHRKEAALNGETDTKKPARAPRSRRLALVEQAAPANPADAP